jgi:hypothetical protein
VAQEAVVKAAETADQREEETADQREEETVEQPKSSGSPRRGRRPLISHDQYTLDYAI